MCLVLFLHTTISEDSSYQHTNASMAVQSRPGNSFLLKVGNASFTLQDVQMCYFLYNERHLLLWEIKEVSFKEADIREIAATISHVKLDIENVPSSRYPSFTYNPECVDLDMYRVGEPRFTANT